MFKQKQDIKTIPELCQGCTLYKEGWRCPVQIDPGWLYEKNGFCWSKRTDPAVDQRIERDIEQYRNELLIRREGPQNDKS